MGAVRLLPTAQARRWFPDSADKRFECRRGVSAPAFLVILTATLLSASCSEKPAASKADVERERTEIEQQPREDEIAEACVAFVRATKVVPQVRASDCPGCSAGGSELLAFRQMQVERISCSADNCEVTVRLRAAFNPGSAGTITGGLTAWIPQEQRLEYLNGHSPVGEQIY